MTVPTGKKPCLLAVSYYVPGTGFTRVMNTVLRLLTDTFDIHYIGIGYKGEELNLGYTVYPSNVKGGDVYAVSQCSELIQKLQPDICFFLNDYWFLTHFKKVIIPYQPKLKTVAYIPLDGRIRDASTLKELDYLDHVVTYTAFGAKELTKCLAELKENDPSCFQYTQLSTIPHGVDTHTFYPLPNKHELKKKLFPHLPDWWDSFIVLNANSSNPRKRHDLTLRAFAIFVQNKPAGVKLYFHHCTENESERKKLLLLTNELGIEDRIWIPEVKFSHTVPADATLNEIYNACDIGINTSMGEGWGLISFEHAATGAPQIVPDHSACTELWTDHACMLSSASNKNTSVGYLEMAEINIDETAAYMEKLYVDLYYRKSTGHRCYQLAMHPDYNWEKIGNQWKNLFTSLL